MHKHVRVGGSPSDDETVIGLAVLHHSRDRACYSDGRPCDSSLKEQCQHGPSSFLLALYA